MALASNPRQHEPIYDIVPETDVSIEVFYTDRTLETFGRSGAGWFWWPRLRGFSPDGPATGPFATSYAAYRHAMTTPAQIANHGGGAGRNKSQQSRWLGFALKTGHKRDTEGWSNRLESAIRRHRHQRW